MPIEPLWVDGLTPEMVKRAENELNETAESRLQALKDLRRLIDHEDDFVPRTDDSFLLRFLRARKFNMERAYKSLLSYYVFKAQYSRIFTDFKPSELKEIFEMNVLHMMPKRLENGSVVVIFRPGYFDVDLFTPNQLVAATLLGIELGLESEATQVCGECLIFDWTNATFKLLARFARPTLLYTIVKIVQECFPCRIMGIHVVNAPFYVVSIVNNIITPFLTNKIKNKIHIHQSLESFHKFITPEILPEELGGQLGKFDNSDLLRKLLSLEDFFERVKKYGYGDKKTEYFQKRRKNWILF